jgi:hypothetical protein
MSFKKERREAGGNPRGGWNHIPAEKRIALDTWLLFDAPQRLSAKDSNEKK